MNLLARLATWFRQELLPETPPPTFAAIPADVRESLPPDLRDWLKDRLAWLGATEGDAGLALGAERCLGARRYGFGPRSLRRLLHDTEVLRRNPDAAFAFVRNGAGVVLWFWDAPYLGRLLVRHMMETLLRVGVDADPQRFVARIAQEPIFPGHPLLPVLLDATGDRWNPMRDGVLPDASREILFATFRQTTGQDDPAVFLLWNRAAGSGIDAAAFEPG